VLDWRSHLPQFGFDTFARSLVNDSVLFARVFLCVANEQRKIHTCLKEEPLIVKLHPDSLTSSFCFALVDKHLAVGIHDEAGL